MAISLKHLREHKKKRSCLLGIFIAGRREKKEKPTQQKANSSDELTVKSLSHCLFTQQSTGVHILKHTYYHP